MLWQSLCWWKWMPPLRVNRRQNISRDWRENMTKTIWRKKIIKSQSGNGTLRNLIWRKHTQTKMLSNINIVKEQTWLRILSKIFGPWQHMLSRKCYHTVQHSCFIFKIVKEQTWLRIFSIPYCLVIDSICYPWKKQQ